MNTKEQIQELGWDLLSTCAGERWGGALTLSSSILLGMG